jgi:putative ABC transport system permease protein
MKRSLRSWLWRVPLDQEIDEELGFHLEMRTRELVERGMDPKTAREVATQRLGDLASLKRTCADLGRKRDREMRLMQWLEEFRDDVKIALRQMRNSPAFTFIAAVTLALGIGANSAIFALVDTTLLRPLPFPAPDRLVMLWEKSDTTPQSRVSPLNMLDWHERSRTFDVIAGFVPNIGGMVLAGADGTAETHPRQWVTAGFFDVLGVKPVVGRTFTADDDRRRANAVVLSETLWRARFNGDPSIVGRDIRLDGAPYTVVGVVPTGFQFFGRTSMWGLVSIVRRPEVRRAYALHAIGRMKPDIALDAAGSDLAAVAEGLAREFPETNKGRSVVLEPMHDALIGSELRLTSMLFLGVVGIVLLICCANVANLLLARATVRTRELAVRSALGAGRRRIIRQLVTESLVLSAVSGVLAVVIGAAILNIAPSLIPEGLLPTAVTLTFDMRVVAFCAGAAVLVGLLFGLAPAWQATAFSSAPALASDSRTVTGRGGTLRNLLVIGEVATAVLLLFGAGLLLRTLIAVEKVDRGYRAEQVLTMMVDPLGSSYPTPVLLQQFFDDVEREIMSLPGVSSVAWASTLPLGSSLAGSSFFDIVGAPPVDESKRSSADYQIVSPKYFNTLDLPIVAGRGFDERDTRDKVPVCIVNEAFVRNHLQGRSPLGVQIALRPTGSPQSKPDVRQIVGVARQVKERPDETEDLLQVYVPMAQDLMDDMYLLVRPTSQRAEVLAGSVRAAIGRVDKEQLVSVRDVMTLDDIAWDATARHRFRAVLVITFAALALVLAMVGVFGIFAYSVQQRVREFGVRIAMGASMSDVLRLVLGGAVRVIAVGMVIGLGLAAVLSRSLASVLFGVEPLDPLTFGSVALVLLVTAVISTAGPAWRAARIDPAVTLRGE